MTLHRLSRPPLESQVRPRVSAIDNVEILDGHDLVEPIAPTPQRVTGARVVNRETGYMDDGDAEHSPSKELLDFREAVLSAAETSPALSEKPYRSMNLVDPPTDYSPLPTS